jgi:hypothetical protein
MLTRLFRNELYPTGLDFKLVEGYPNTNSGCVLIVPGRYWWEHVDEINSAIRRYQWVLFIRTGDEEDLFDVNQLDHPNVLYWIQTPRKDRGYPFGARFFGVGYPPHFNDLSTAPPGKVVDVFLSAQATHTRRTRAFEALKGFPNSNVEATAGFTQGMPVGEYVGQMCGAKVAPAPSGAVSPDSFRLYEALEAHCVPIADDISPAYDSEGYWRLLFPSEPFPTLTDYQDLCGYIEDQLKVWPTNANRIAAWWMRQKREMVLWLEADLKALGAL